MQRSAAAQSLSRSIAYAAGVFAFLLVAGCDSADNRPLDSIASAIRARASLVQSLKTDNKISENGRGYLRSNAGVYLDVQDRRIVEEENHERSKVFALLAKSHQLSRADVEKVFAKKASGSR